MPIWDRCNAPGCFKDKGVINASCTRCVASGYLDRAVEDPVYRHDWRAFTPSMEKSINRDVGLLWICFKCGAATNVRVPPVIDCPIEHESEESDLDDLVDQLNDSLGG